MITELRIPYVGVNDAQAILVEWTVKDLALVQPGQEICLIETSKITQSVTAVRAGYVHQKAKPGEELPVNAVMGWITDQVDDKPGEIATPAAASGPVEITRKARDLAARLGIPLDKLPSGKGIIREQDVRAIAGQGEEPPSPIASGGHDLPAGLPPLDFDRSKPLSHAQRLTQERMVDSLHRHAHCCLTMEAGIGAVLAGLTRLTEQTGKIVRLNDAFIYACSRALVEFPGFNGFFWNDRHNIYKEIHMGVAMDFEDKLMVPIVKNADKKSLLEVAQESALLQMNLARKTLSPADCEGSTFTLTNLGGLGVQSFTPIINGWQAAILGIGAPLRRAVRDQQEWREAQCVHLNLSFDHRLHNGMQAARFLTAVITALDQAVRV